MTAEELHVGEMTEDDVPALLRLWDEAGWGELSPDDWRAQHRDAPHGPSRVIVARNDAGTVVGQLTLLRRPLNVRGTTLPASRVFGMIVSPSYRRAVGYLPLRRHPVRRLISTALQNAAEDGDAAVYALPDRRVLRIASLVAPSARLARFPFWSRPLGPAPDLPSGHESVPDVAEADVEALWSRCRTDLVCPVRDARTLAWKSLFRPRRLEGIVRDGEVVAVVASRVHGDRQWLVEDVLAVDDRALAAAVVSVVRAAAQEATVQEVRKVGTLVTPGRERVMAACGFVPDDYTFTLFLLPLGSRSPAAELDPEQVSLAPDD